MEAGQDPIYERWLSTASSADGNIIALASLSDTLWYSLDSGASWASSNSPFNRGWHSLASSADGSRIVAASAGSLYTSGNNGVNWTPLPGSPGPNVASLALSADGAKQVAVIIGGGIYTSTDSGITWRANSAPNTNWISVASSADGRKLVAAVYGGGIYVSQSAPTPLLSILPSGGNLVLSWVVPSTTFTLQENHDLTLVDWSDVTNTPAFNYSNLRRQLTIPNPPGTMFYRLVSQ